jgi:hypothetical protein
MKPATQVAVQLFHVLTNAVAMDKSQRRQRLKSSGIDPECGAAVSSKMSVFTS